MIFSSHKNICACKKSAPFDPVWPYLAPCGPIWPRLPRLALFDPVWPHLAPFGPILSRLVPLGPICPHLPCLAPLGHFLISISRYFKVPIRQGEGDVGGLVLDGDDQLVLCDDDYDQIVI